MIVLKYRGILSLDCIGIFGFNEVWLVQGVGNVDNFLSLVKQRLQDQFIQDGVQDLKSQAEQLFICVKALFIFKVI